MSLLSAETHTAAVLAVLRSTGKPGGDGEAPPGATGVYWILYPLGGMRDGILGRPWDDGWLGYQVTCVAPSRQGAEWMADRCDRVLLDEPLTVAGRQVHVRREGGGDVRRDDETAGPTLWYCTPRYTLTSTA